MRSNEPRYGGRPASKRTLLPISSSSRGQSRQPTQRAPPPSTATLFPSPELDAYIEKIAQREGFTPDLLRAVIAKESSFHPCAISSKGAQGLMQLMPGTAAELGVAHPFNPEENIDAGARYLGELISRYKGDLSQALGAYNAGPAKVDTYGGLPPIPETMNYVSGILEKLKKTSRSAPPSGAAE